MPHRYHRSTIYLLLALLLLFSFVFLVALFNYKRQQPVFNLGLSYEVEDILVMVLSFIAIMRVIVLLLRVEHKKELMQRVTV